MGKKNYSINEESKKQFAGIFVLDYMVNKPCAFSLLLEDGDVDLETVLEWLMVKTYVEIKDKEKYVPTAKGRDCLKLFLARYSEYLNIFDVYCAVDLEKGEFAFEKYFDYEDPQQWQNYLQKDYWEDLRIAVASFKNIDPVEIVFMSFINEGRFGKDETGWQFDLLLGTVWDQILEICNCALTLEELGYEDDQGVVEPKDVMADIIRQGTEIIINLHKQESNFAGQAIDHGEDNDDGGDESIVERVIVQEYPDSYYDPYLDPYYISPLWLGLWLI
jgi:hypothetical protein